MFIAFYIRGPAALSYKRQNIRKGSKGIGALAEQGEMKVPDQQMFRRCAP
jgi:hypothetical protein